MAGPKASFPDPERWQQAATVASPTLAADAETAQHVLERFMNKYLRAVLGAQNPTAEERGWEGFYFWLVFPATNRKPFSLPEEEAHALIAAFRVLVQGFRDAVRNPRDLG